MITQADIDEQLANAQANGFFTEPGNITVVEIVQDLQMCSAICDGEPDEILTPLVKTWYDAQIFSFGDSQVGKAADC